MAVYRRSARGVSLGGAVAAVLVALCGRSASAQPISELRGIALPASVPTIALLPLDNAAEIRFDALNPGPNKRLRTGVVRNTGFDPAIGQWVSSPGGGLWVMDIWSPNAEAMRLKISGLALPAGASMVIYNPEDTTQCIGPIEDTGPVGDGTYWAPRVWNSRARIEVFMPAAAGVPGGAAPVRIDEIAHIYRPWQPPAEGEVSPAVGPCHNDVACSPTWANVARATGLLEFVESGSTFNCSGTLVRTLNNDRTPYFLSANHCIATQAIATTASVYWFYQKSTCNGTVPTFANSPESTVADLVYTSSTNDLTLLLLRGSLPANPFFASWRSTSTANATSVVGIHHPDGDWKRITFGTRSTATPPCSPTQHIRANWTSGVTEVGSSGSGLFRVDTQELIGVLSCGPSFCGAPASSLTDSYGDFTSAYGGGLSSSLAAGSDDIYEPNATCATANIIAIVNASGTRNNLVVKSTNEDWYSVNIPAGGSATVTLSFTAANGNLGLQSFASCGGSAIGTSASTGSTQTLTISNATGPFSTFFYRVYMFGNSTRNTYSMTYSVVTPSGPSNNLCVAAAPIGLGTTNFTTVGASTDGPVEAACNFSSDSQVSQDVWYRHTAAATGSITASTCASTTWDTKLAVYGTGTCPGATPNTAIACSDDECGPSNMQSTVTFDVVAGQQYLLRVGGFGSASGTGQLSLVFTPPPPPPPTRCNPADVADDTGNPLPPNNVGPAGSNSGVTEADYNAFFAGYFDSQPQCDIANDDSSPLPPFGTQQTNNGVTEGDYNLFFSLVFEGCAL
jgi:hypothetical protein